MVIGPLIFKLGIYCPEKKVGGGGRELFPNFLYKGLGGSIIWQLLEFFLNDSWCVPLSLLYSFLHPAAMVVDMLAGVTADIVDYEDKDNAGDEWAEMS